MKAFHFELVTGERGTLAGCADDMTPQEALAVLNFQFTERVESVTESGRDWPDPARDRASVDEPLLLLERLQNIRRRQKRDTP